MHLGNEPVSWQACIQGCRCSLPKAKKHIITREILRATGQFLLAQDTCCGSHCWRRERGRGMRASDPRCPSAEPLTLWFTGMRIGSQCVQVRWKPSKNPGQYWTAGVGEQRLLSQLSSHEISWINTKINFCWTQGRIALSLWFNCCFSHLCFKLSPQNLSCLPFLWSPCTELGSDPCLRLVIFSHHSHRSGGLT